MKPFFLVVGVMLAVGSVSCQGPGEPAATPITMTYAVAFSIDYHTKNTRVPPGTGIRTDTLGDKGTATGTLILEPGTLPTGQPTYRATLTVSSCSHPVLCASGPPLGFVSGEGGVYFYSAPLWFFSFATPSGGSTISLTVAIDESSVTGSHSWILTPGPSGEFFGGPFVATRLPDPP